MMSRHRTERIRPVVTEDQIRPDLMRIGRRAALKGGLSLASLALLTGCDLSTHSGVFKSAKNIQAISVTNTYSGGYWEDQGYNWFSGS